MQDFHLDEIPLATIEGANSLAEAKAGVKQAGFINVHQKEALSEVIGRDILGYSIARHFAIRFHFSRAPGTGFCGILNAHPTNWTTSNLIGQFGDLTLDTAAEEIHFCWAYYHRRYGRMFMVSGPGTISGSGGYTNAQVAFWKKGKILVSLWLMDGGKWDVIAFNI